MCGYLAACYYQAVLVIQTIGICQSCLVICMEEVLFTKACDLIVDPVKQSSIALRYCGSDGISAAQGRNTYGIAFILQSKCDDLSVVVCPCYGSTVFKSFLSGCIGIELL